MEKHSVLSLIRLVPSERASEAPSGSCNVVRTVLQSSSSSTVNEIRPLRECCCLSELHCPSSNRYFGLPFHCWLQLSMSSRLGQEIARVTVLFSSLYVIQEYGVAVSMTVGPSMMPTFNSHGDIVIVNRSKQARFTSVSSLCHPIAHLTATFMTCRYFQVIKLAML